MDITQTQAIGFFHNNDEVMTRVDGDYIIFRILLYSQFGAVVGSREFRVHFTDIDMVEEVI
jgi:hypothetical protein